MNAPSPPLEGRTVLVVGAGSVASGWSNGKACAVAYARAGASVACVDLHPERAGETAALIEEHGGAALPLSADATSETDMTRVVRDCLDEFGGLDVVHNNVGIGHTSGAPDNIRSDEWDREIAQNLTSAYLGIRCSVPAMRERAGGVITNTSSVVAVRFLRKPNVAYTAAKAAVEAMTRACAATYGRDNIRVNCIRVGFSETPLMEESLRERNLTGAERDEAMRRSRAKVPLRSEHTDPFDVAAAAVFLASDHARHITGAILDVDGGLECAPI